MRARRWCPIMVRWRLDFEIRSGRREGPRSDKADKSDGACRAKTVERACELGSLGRKEQVTNITKQA